MEFTFPDEWWEFYTPDYSLCKSNEVRRRDSFRLFCHRLNEIGGVLLSEYKGKDQNIMYELHGQTSYSEVGNFKRTYDGFNKLMGDIEEQGDYFLGYEPNKTKNNNRWIRIRDGLTGGEVITLQSNYKNICKARGRFYREVRDRGNEVIGTYQNEFTEVEIKCKRCGSNRSVIPMIYTKGESVCKLCGDKTSFPEKCMTYVLKSLEDQGVINGFLTEVSTSRLGWEGRYRYDFYIPCHNIIIEIHGKQHYEWTGFNVGVSAQQIIDKKKEVIARENGVQNYITVNSSVSTLKWMKDNILNCGIYDILNIQKDMIDWDGFKSHMLTSKLAEACDMKKKNPSITYEKIGNAIGVSGTTAMSYLRRGREIGLL